MGERKPTDIMRWIAATELFAALPAPSVAELAAAGRLVALDRGCFLFRKSEIPRSLDLVTEGRIHVTSTSRDGSELLLGVLEAGDLVGEIGAIDGDPRCTNAVADQPSRVFRIPLPTALAVVTRHPESALALSRILCRHLRNAVANLENVGLEKARTRLWSRLMQLSHRYGVEDPQTGALRIQHGLSQQNLADSVGLTRVLVNRKLSSWRELGLVETGRGFIVLRNPDALERYVWQESDPVAHRSEPRREAASDRPRRDELDEDA